MSKPQKFGGYTLYRIYYGEHLIYLGRTMQPLQNRIRGHIFKKPMHRELSIELISKIEYSTFQSEADMYLYEIYFINLYKPPLNRDDKAPDALSVSLPDVDWRPFETPLWDKWKSEVAQKDAEDKARRSRKTEALTKDREMRRKRRTGEITEEEYWNFWESEVRGL